MPTDPPEDITPYDRYRYTSNAFAQSHPARLATVAAAFGIASAPATGCRVLELGCGDGSNLIPLAFYLPDSTCVGVDLARTPIAAGCARIARLELRNIELRQGNLIDACDDLGTFDYVIAHGLYSWVPDAVRPHILDRKSTRLNSSHPSISYAVFCLKKKKIAIVRLSHEALLYKRSAEPLLRFCSAIHGSAHFQNPQPTRAFRLRRVMTGRTHSMPCC